MEKSIEAYSKKLNNYYDSDGKLLQYPSKRPLRIIALIKIVEQMDADRKYTEKEINEIIRSRIAFCDIELIRREMFQYKLLGRLRDGSAYWVESDWKNAYAEYIDADQTDFYKGSGICQEFPYTPEREGIPAEMPAAAISGIVKNKNTFLSETVSPIAPDATTPTGPEI